MNYKADIVPEIIAFVKSYPTGVETSTHKYEMYLAACAKIFELDIKINNMLSLLSAVDNEHNATVLMSEIEAAEEELLKIIRGHIKNHTRV